MLARPAGGGLTFARMLPAAQINMLPMANLAQLLLLKEAVDAASEQWEREQAERRRREADSSAVAQRAKEEERARQEAIEAGKSRQAKPSQAKNPPPVFPFFWWELASGTSVHMNGRIYDPLLGRMLSADPHIQSPTNLQNYNRYSYVTNNPLSMTDPSGFFFKKLFKGIKKFFKKFWRPIVTIALVLVAAVFVGPWAAGLLNITSTAGVAVVSGVVAGFTGGFVGTLLGGGSLSAAFKEGLIDGAIGGFGVFAGLKIAKYLQRYMRLSKEILEGIGKGIAYGVGQSVARGGKVFKNLYMSIAQQMGTTLTKAIITDAKAVMKLDSINKQYDILGSLEAEDYEKLKKALAAVESVDLRGALDLPNIAGTLIGGAVGGSIGYAVGGADGAAVGFISGAYYGYRTSGIHVTGGEKTSDNLRYSTIRVKILGFSIWEKEVQSSYVVGGPTKIFDKTIGGQNYSSTIDTTTVIDFHEMLGVNKGWFMPFPQSGILDSKTPLLKYR